MTVTPKQLQHVHFWFTLFWIVMVPISLALGWLESVTYVSALSLWALVSGHWSAWQAARTEVKQDKSDSINVNDTNKQKGHK